MIVIGADLGGTSLRVGLFSDGVELSRSEGPGGSMRAGAGSALAERLAELARPLLSRTGAVRADAFVVGAAGAGRSAERDELSEALQKQRLAWRVVVTSDAELARAAAFQGKPGILLVAGTGSIAVALDESGGLRRLGGLGWRMGDQGSAYWLGCRALEAVGLMHDSLGPSTRLAESLPAAARVPGVAALIRWSTTASVADIAALGPAVIDTADRGDSVAARLVSEAVEKLLELVAAAGGGKLPVALAGGLLATGRPLRERVSSRLRSVGIECHEGMVDPCRGAPVLAAQSA